MSSTIDDTVNYIVDEFNECEEKSYDVLSEIVCNHIIHPSDVFNVITELGSVDDNTGNESIREYAISLLYDYILYNGLVGMIDG